MSVDCPCGSGKIYGDCCQPLHDDTVIAATAEALMRSRYSAYVLKLSSYLTQTWHPSTRPHSLDVTADATVWLGLAIITTEQGGERDEIGKVEYVARYRGGQLHERSNFVKEEGRWFYLDGEIVPIQPVARRGRNEPCPCGSGRKYKKCCG